MIMALLNSHLDTCSPVGGTALEGLGGVTLLEEVCHWLWGFKSPCHPHLVLSAYHLQIKVCALGYCSSATPAATLPSMTVMNSNPLKPWAQTCLPSICFSPVFTTVMRTITNKKKQWYQVGKKRHRGGNPGMILSGLSQAVGSLFSSIGAIIALPASCYSLALQTRPSYCPLLTS